MELPFGCFISELGEVNMSLRKSSHDQKSRWLVLFALVVLAAGCGLEDGENSSEGGLAPCDGASEERFEATVRGSAVINGETQDIDVTYGGVAHYANIGSHFILNLYGEGVHPAGANMTTNSRSNTGQPSVGEYQHEVDNSFNEGIHFGDGRVSLDGAEEADLFSTPARLATFAWNQAQEGVMTVTTSCQGQVKGNFEYSAEIYDGLFQIDDGYEETLILEGGPVGEVTVRVVFDATSR